MKSDYNLATKVSASHPPSNALNDVDISKLKPGDNHYMAYVGPPEQYDFVGAMQFRLLCSLGLRAKHNLLDFGCGSLRAGRLFLPYLEPGKYFGVEPNKWLIEDAIANQVGNDLITLKKPRFDHNSDFKCDMFSTEFDYIIAQSIFSHTGRQLTVTALRQFEKCLKSSGLIAATFMERDTESGEEGWVYPGCVFYQPETIEQMANETGLFVRRIPWYHPRQAWYILTKDRERLPPKTAFHHLSGAVLYEAEFRDSYKPKSWLGALQSKFFG